MNKTNTKPDHPLGILIVTHGDFGAELLNAAELVLGKQEKCQHISVDVSRDVDNTVSAIRKAIKETDSGSGVLILTDLFGGSPTTLSLSLLKTEDIEVVTGVNLPMLIKALQSRTEEISKLASDVSAAGKQGIVVAGEMLRGKGSREKR